MPERKMGVIKNRR